MTTFPLFPRFPIEIRRLIWREALFAPLEPSYHTENCITRLDPRAWNFSRKRADLNVPFLHILPFRINPRDFQRWEALTNLKKQFERTWGTRQHELAHEKNQNINTPLNTNTTNPEFVSDEFKKYSWEGRMAYLERSCRAESISYLTSLCQVHPPHDNHDDRYDAGTLIKPVVDNIAALCREAREEMLLLKKRLGSPRGWADLRESERAKGGVVCFRDVRVPMQGGPSGLHPLLIPTIPLSHSLSLDNGRLDETGRRVRGPRLLPAALAHVEEMVAVWTPNFCWDALVGKKGQAHPVHGEACQQMADRCLKDMLAAHPRLRTLYIYDPYARPQPDLPHPVKGLRFRGAGASFYEMLPTPQNGWDMRTVDSLGIYGTVSMWTLLFNITLKNALKEQQRKTGQKRIVRVVPLACIPDTELRP
ncbi:hypothetical protein B0J18DRAFT_460194 [Chaetomium sp. MPI-SDFR-AT-0129]|nr:hypothetical protein B0J18DRAFT_460194 [Chaetomium sp. MPI-SDFR-AT-0129]